MGILQTLLNSDCQEEFAFIGVRVYTQYFLPRYYVGFIRDRARLRRDGFLSLSVSVYIRYVPYSTPVYRYTNAVLVLSVTRGNPSLMEK